MVREEERRRRMDDRNRVGGSARVEASAFFFHPECHLLKEVTN